MEVMIQVVLLSPKSNEDQKKKVFTAIWLCIRQELVGFIRAKGTFFSDHTALKSHWGDAKS